MYLALALYSIGQALVIPNWVAGPSNLIAFNSVVTRKQEIGVRMALGATRGSIYALTFAEAGAPVFAGAIAGLAASLSAGRAIQRLLYGTQTVDPPVILIVTALFLLSAAAAGFTRRSTRIQSRIFGSGSTPIRHRSITAV